MNDTTPRKFIDYVQHHERTWGNQTYKNRPSLAEILNAQVVVFWKTPPTSAKQQSSNLYTLTLYNSLDELGDALAKMLLRASITGDPKYVSRIYAGGKLVRIKRVQVEFETEE